MKTKIFDIIIFFSAFIFGYGYLLVIINSYYLFKYSKYVEIEREDMVSRLGFFSNTIGYLSLPISIFIILLIHYLILKKWDMLKSKFFVSCIGIIFLGVLSYFKFIYTFLYGSASSILAGVLLLIVSVFSFYFSLKNISDRATVLT